MSFTIKSKYLTIEKTPSRWKKAGWVFLFVFLLVLSFGAGMYLPGKSALINNLAQAEAKYGGELLGKYGIGGRIDLNKDVNFNLYWSVWDALKENYVEKEGLNEKELFYGSIKGMVAAAGDPYTVFMDPKITQDFQDDMSGKFEGIGAEIGLRDNLITIVAPLAGSPAEKSGLKVGDKIIKINNESSAELTIDGAVSKIRGPKGTAVTLTIARSGASELQDFTIIRDTITIKSVKTEMKNDNIFVITITSFNDDTVGLFNKAIMEALGKNPKGIVLDLRNNPGGYLDSAVEIASAWIDKGVIVSEESHDKTKTDYQALGNARLKNFPTVVLVNEGSASASEIVAGALKDDKKATIVGKKTFGKGSVQTVEGFTDGSSLKVTVAKWLTPNGYNINKEGIAPDVEVDLTIDDFQANKDPQMEKAISILNIKN